MKKDVKSQKRKRLSSSLEQEKNLAVKWGGAQGGGEGERIMEKEEWAGSH